ncbi:MAG: ABC-2 family transporter protein [Candidatus Micrarchaeota archaeon]|nr:ABC-2 family transporter protein [Candidatus Micrarchaeota archaeon]
MENRLVRDIRFYLLSQYYWWRGFLVYREQAAMWLIYSLINITYSYITVAVIYTVSSGIAGWSYYQMLFLVSTATIVMNALYYNVNIGWLMDLLRRGGMDPYLIRPYGRISVFLSSQEGIGSAGGIVGAFVVLLYAASVIGANPVGLLAYLVLLVAGAITLVLFTLMLVMLFYHLLRSAQFVQKLLNFVGQASQYPLAVYGFVGQLLFTLVLPVGFASYYPAKAFLSSISLAGFLEALLISFAISAISYLAFNRLQVYYLSGGG